MIDRPSGLSGHSGANGAVFNRRFGACVLGFVETPSTGPAACPDAG
jgi:hypothetical protein